MSDLSYAFEGTTRDLDFDDVVHKVTTALQDEGFGVVTTIDIQDVLKKKLNTDFRPYVILGACNPHLARTALEADPYIGLLLPCNVVVQELPGGAVHIAIVDPKSMFSLVPEPSLEPVAGEARERLIRALGAVTRP